MCIKSVCVFKKNPISKVLTVQYYQIVISYILTNLLSTTDAAPIVSARFSHWHDPNKLWDQRKSTHNYDIVVALCI